MIWIAAGGRSLFLKHPLKWSLNMKMSATRTNAFEASSQGMAALMKIEDYLSKIGLAACLATFIGATASSAHASSTLLDQGKVIGTEFPCQKSCALV